MEVTVEGAENVPAGSYLSISAGGSRRQAPLVPRQKFAFGGQSAAAAVASGGSGTKVDIWAGVQGTDSIPAGELGSGSAVGSEGAVPGESYKAPIQAPVRALEDGRSSGAEASRSGQAAEMVGQSSSTGSMVKLNVRPTGAVEDVRQAASSSSTQEARGANIHTLRSTREAEGERSATAQRSSTAERKVAKKSKGKRPHSAPRLNRTSTAETRTYFSNHNILPWVERMLKTLIQDQPHNPWTTIASMLPEGTVIGPSGFPVTPTDTGYFVDISNTPGFREQFFRFRPSVGSWLMPKQKAIAVGGTILAIALSKLNSNFELAMEAALDVTAPMVKTDSTAVIEFRYANLDYDKVKGHTTMIALVRQVSEAIASCVQLPPALIDVELASGNGIVTKCTINTQFGDGAEVIKKEIETDAQNFLQTVEKLSAKIPNIFDAVTDGSNTIIIEGLKVCIEQRQRDADGAYATVSTAYPDSDASRMDITQYTIPENDLTLTGMNMTGMNMTGMNMTGMSMTSTSFRDMTCTSLNSSLILPSSATYTLPLPLGRPQAAEEPAPAVLFIAKPWNQRPSTGTWLARASKRQPAPFPEKVEEKVGLNLPFYKMPSCGTWLLPKPEPEEAEEPTRLSESAVVSNYFMASCIPRLMLEEIPSSQATTPMVSGVGPLDTPGFRPISVEDINTLSPVVVSKVPSDFVEASPSLAFLSPEIQVAAGGTAVADAIGFNDDLFGPDSPDSRDRSQELPFLDPGQSWMSGDTGKSAESWVSEKLNAMAGEQSMVVRVEFFLENLDSELLAARQDILQELKKQLSICVSRRLKVRENVISVQLSGEDGIHIGIGMFCRDQAAADELQARVDSELEGLLDELRTYAAKVAGINECCKLPGGVGVSRLATSSSPVPSAPPSVPTGYAELAKGGATGVMTDAHGNIVASGSMSPSVSTMTLTEFKEQVEQRHVVQLQCPSELKPGDKMTILDPNTGEMIVVQVPPGVQPGQAFAVQTPQMVQAQCPPGAKPGDKIMVVVPETGQSIEVEVPLGAKPGEPFPVQTPQVTLVRPQAGATQQSLTLQCPEGAVPGSVVEITTPDGLSVQVTVPEDAQPGQSMTVEYSSPPQQATASAEGDVVDPGAKASASMEFSQFQAMKQRQETSDGAIPTEEAVTLQIPEGSVPGSVVQVAAPDGTMIDITVPEDGQTITAAAYVTENDDGTFNVQYLPVSPQGGAVAVPEDAPSSVGLVEVQCPPDTKPGDKMIVLLETGEQIVVVVPEGVQPGQPFVVPGVAADSSSSATAELESVAGAVVVRTIPSGDPFEGGSVSGSYDEQRSIVSSAGPVEAAAVENAIAMAEGAAVTSAGVPYGPSSSSGGSIGPNMVGGVMREVKGDASLSCYSASATLVSVDAAIADNITSCIGGTPVSDAIDAPPVLLVASDVTCLGGQGYVPGVPQEASDVASAGYVIVQGVSAATDVASSATGYAASDGLGGCATSFVSQTFYNAQGNMSPDNLTLDGGPSITLSSASGCILQDSTTLQPLPQVTAYVTENGDGTFKVEYLPVVDDIEDMDSVRKAVKETLSDEGGASSVAMSDKCCTQLFGGEPDAELEMKDFWSDMSGTDVSVDLGSCVSEVRSRPQSSSRLRRVDEDGDVNSTVSDSNSGVPQSFTSAVVRRAVDGLEARGTREGTVVSSSSYLPPGDDAELLSDRSNRSIASKVVNFAANQAEIDVSSDGSKDICSQFSSVFGIPYTSRSAGASGVEGLRAVDPLFPMCGGDDKIEVRSSASSGVPGSFASGIVNNAMSECGSRHSGEQNVDRHSEMGDMDRPSEMRDIVRPLSAAESAHGARPESVSSTGSRREANALVDGVIGRFGVEKGPSSSGVNVSRDKSSATDASAALKAVSASVPVKSESLPEAAVPVKSESLPGSFASGLIDTAQRQAEVDLTDSGVGVVDRDSEADLYARQGSAVADAIDIDSTKLQPQGQMVLAISFFIGNLDFDKVSAAGLFGNLKQQLQEGIALEARVPLDAVDMEFCRGSVVVKAMIFCDSHGTADTLKNNLEGRRGTFLTMLNHSSAKIPCLADLTTAGAPELPDCHTLIFGVERLDLDKERSKLASAAGIAPEAADPDLDANFMVEALPQFLLAGNMPPLSAQEDTTPPPKSEPEEELPQIRFDTGAFVLPTETFVAEDPGAGELILRVPEASPDPSDIALDGPASSASVGNLGLVLTAEQALAAEAASEQAQAEAVAAERAAAEKAAADKAAADKATAAKAAADKAAADKAEAERLAAAEKAAAEQAAAAQAAAEEEERLRALREEEAAAAERARASKEAAERAAADRAAAEKAAMERSAAEQAAAEQKAAAEKAAAEQAEAEKAAAEKVAAEKAAAEKAAAEKAAAEQAAAENAAAEKAAAERAAAEEKAAAERAAADRAAAEKAAAEQAAAEAAAAESAEAEQAATAARAEAERLAAQRAAAEAAERDATNATERAAAQAAAEKAAAEQVAAEQAAAEAEQAAARKAEEERAAAEKAAAEQAVAEQVAAERAAADLAASEKAAAEAEQEAARKAAQEKAAAEKALADQVAAEQAAARKAEEERAAAAAAAAEQAAAEAEQAAVRKAEEERAAAEKAATEKALAEQLAAERAAADLAAAEQAAAKAEQEAARKADEERAAAEKALAEQVAAEKAATDLAAAQQAAAEAEQAAARRAEEERAAADKAAAEKAAAEKASLEQAAAERAAAEQATAQRLAAEQAAARAAAEKAAAEKTAADEADRLRALREEVALRSLAAAERAAAEESAASKAAMEQAAKEHTMAAERAAAERSMPDMSQSGPLQSKTLTHVSVADQSTLSNVPAGSTTLSSGPHGSTTMSSSPPQFTTTLEPWDNRPRVTTPAASMVSQPVSDGLLLSYRPSTPGALAGSTQGPDGPWLLKPSAGTWLSVPPLQTSKPSGFRSVQQPTGGLLRPQPAKLAPRPALLDSRSVPVPAMSSRAMAEVCACGSTFAKDSLYCRKCGKQRPEAGSDTWGLQPKTSADASPKKAVFLKPDFEISRDASAAPDAPWLLHPSTGTWLSHPPLQMAGSIEGSWSRSVAPGKWVTSAAAVITADSVPTPDDVSADFRSLTKSKPSKVEQQTAPRTLSAETLERSVTPVPSLPFEQLQREPESVGTGATLPPATVLPPSEQGPSASKLAALREEAEMLEASGDEAEAANDSVRSENVALREELNRLLALASPSDTPIMTQRALAGLR